MCGVLSLPELCPEPRVLRITLFYRSIGVRFRDACTFEGLQFRAVPNFGLSSSGMCIFFGVRSQGCVYFYWFMTRGHTLYSSWINIRLWRIYQIISRYLCFGDSLAFLHTSIYLLYKDTHCSITNQVFGSNHTFFFFFFFKVFGGHMSFFGATGTPVLDFWWRLLWV